MAVKKAGLEPGILLVLLLGVIFIFLSQVRFSWDRLAPEYCRTTNCYCEPFQNGFFVLQPITAYSNLGFLIASAYIYKMGTGRQNSPADPRRTRADWNLLGICCLLAGSFSFFSHASLTRVGEWLDLMGVYILAGFFLFLNLRSLFPAGKGYYPYLYGIALVLLGLQMAFAPRFQLLFVSGLTGGVILGEIAGIVTGRIQGDQKILLLAVLVLAVGGYFWGGGGGSSGCLFNSGFPAHAIWHLSAAAAAAALFCYHRGVGA